MPRFLSWKDKFRALIAVSLISLAAMVGAALWINERLGGSFEAQRAATSFRGETLDLLNDWLRVGAQRRGLRPETSERYAGQLAEIERQAAALGENASRLGDPALLRQAERVGELLRTDAGLQRQWLEQNQALGLRPEDGARQALATATKPLEAITIGLIQPFIREAVGAQRDYLATFDPGFADKARAAIDGLLVQIDELDWRDSQIGMDTVAFRDAFLTADTIIGQIDRLQARLDSQGQDIEQAIDRLLGDLRDGIIARTAAEVERARTSAALILGLVFLVGAAVLLLTLGRASSALLGQLTRVNDALARVAAGDLTGQLAVGRNPRDEFNQLGLAVNQMVQSICSLIRQVADGNEDLKRLHGHLNDAMKRLDDNSAQVEQQTEQATAASQQISRTISEIAERTTDVGTATRAACDSAQVGSQVIGTSVENMRRLSGLIRDTHAQVSSLTHSATQVNSIIGVINGLADQTNLLALNAAIEAARAGEAGRGFSVVADEVRSLAQKTVSATTDITRIVDELGRQTKQMDQLIGSGLELAHQSETDAGQAAGAIDEITLSVEKLTSEMNQVVVAVEEISTTTEDIAGKMEEINTHTGRTRTLRQTLDDHTRSLSGQVQALHERTGRFRV
ncbi:methyl-accepting chemotaxis protein [Stutzerimonas azotifigens]|uniref:methyl-accepting chemotaxis protein n=1 Tax=Stutzerimonas azotifigens TaxID=291995 RepID=UPI0004162EB8|nr:methyl-accepting chemotaxis protein [Stutzerimonas azotifigens]